MKEQISKIKEEALRSLNEIKNLQELNDLKVKYLGKKGELTSILRGMGSLSAEERPIIGGLVNEVRNEIEEQIQEIEVKLKEEEINQKLQAEKIDITLPSSKIIRGSKHPINRVI